MTKLRYRTCKTCGDLHEMSEWPHNCMPEANHAKSDIPFPSLILDNTPGGIHGFRSMADGKMYDSKSRYYESLRDQGMEIVGNDSSHTRTPKAFSQQDGPTQSEIVQDIKRAQEELGGLSEAEVGNMMRSRPELAEGFGVD